MAFKTVPISARISHEDAEFISQLKINGATTPSDKLRAIIAEARRKSSQQHDYLGYLNIMQDILSPANDQIKDAEQKLQIHSELVTRLIEWLPDIYAYFVAKAIPESDVLTTDMLNELEDGLSKRVFRLIESVMQMGVTQRCPCYDDMRIANNIEPILDLSQLIKISQKREGDEK